MNKRAIPQSPRPPKYGNRAVVIDGIRFASVREGERYRELALAQKGGAITALTTHPRWDFNLDGVHIGSYTADFLYRENGEAIVEDVKSGPTKTTAYRLRKKMMEAFYGIEVREV